MKKRYKKKRAESKRNFGFTNAMLLGILILTAIIYIPSLNNQFTNWDDTSLITENPLITELNTASLHRIFSEPYFNNYQPLHILSYALEYQIYGLNPMGYHFFSLLLHLLNSLLVYFFIRLLSKGNIYLSLFITMLFAIHPLHVESVAWASERKDLLYTFFFLGSLMCYIKYLRKKLSVRFYFFAFILFILSALSKAMAVSLVPVLILIDYYERRQLSFKAIIDKIPFVATAIIFGLISIWAAADSIDQSDQFTMLDRVFFASGNFILYVLKLLFPFDLSAYYPYPPKPFNWMYYVALPVVILTTVFVLSQFKKRPYLVFGGGFFASTIFLVLMLIPVGPAIFSERYSYIPSIGLYFMIGSYVQEKITKTSLGNSAKGKVLIAVFFFYSIYLMATTFQRTKVWQDSFTLWNDVVLKYPKSSTPYQNLGDAYFKIGNNEMAVKNFTMAISLNENDKLAYYNRGNAYANMGLMTEAGEDFTQAIKLDSSYADAYNKRGVTNAMLGNWNSALDDYTKALTINPGLSDVYYNRAVGHFHRGEKELACLDFKKGAELGNTQCILAADDLCR